MSTFKILSNLELETIQGSAIPWGDLPDYFDFGDSIGRWLAHRPVVKVKQPFCYNYGPAYPVPVLPCG